MALSCVWELQCDNAIRLSCIVIMSWSPSWSSPGPPQTSLSKSSSSSSRDMVTVECPRGQRPFIIAVQLSFLLLHTQIQFTRWRNIFQLFTQIHFTLWRNIFELFTQIHFTFWRRNFKLFIQTQNINHLEHWITKLNQPRANCWRRQWQRLCRPP